MTPRRFNIVRRAVVNVWYWGFFCGWAATTATMAVATLVYAWSRA